MEEMEPEAAARRRPAAPDNKDVPRNRPRVEP
jgi:hypothetical protein